MIASECSVFRRLASNTLIPRWNALHSTNGVFSCMISLLMDTPTLIDKKSAETDQSLKIGQSLLCDRTARLSGYVLIKRTPISLNDVLFCVEGLFLNWVRWPSSGFRSANPPCGCTGRSGHKVHQARPARPPRRRSAPRSCPRTDYGAHPVGDNQHRLVLISRDSAV